METKAIIDDDIYIGKLLEEVLTKEGYAVLRAYSDTEALYLLSEKMPDLLLLNLMSRNFPARRFLQESRIFP